MGIYKVNINIGLEPPVLLLANKTWNRIKFCFVKLIHKFQNQN
jgi:hypothetical protein